MLVSEHLNKCPKSHSQGPTNKGPSTKTHSQGRTHNGPPSRPTLVPVVRLSFLVLLHAPRRYSVAHFQWMRLNPLYFIYLGLVLGILQCFLQALETLLFPPSVNRESHLSHCLGFINELTWPSIYPSIVNHSFAVPTVFYSFVFFFH